jgi:hypothetical protein
MRLRLHAFQTIDTTDDPAMISEVFGSIGRTKQHRIQIVASPYQPRSDHGLVRPTGVEFRCRTSRDIWRPLPAVRLSFR